MRQRSKGLTALDLLITMSLAVIILLAGIPGLREYTMNQRIKSAIALLHADLNLARTDAISLNTRTVACPGSMDTGCAAHAQWGDGWLVFADMNGDRLLQASEPILRQSMALDSVSALGVDSRRQIRFFPGGTAPGSNSSIVFCDHRGPGKGLKLVISNSGRIRRAKLAGNDGNRCLPA
jgi:type IV fimbrial biogenesis protein FimT